MMHFKWVGAWVLLLVLTAASARGAGGAFDGEWRTSFGVVTLKQTGNDVTGTYGDAGQFTLKGSVQGRKLTFEYQEGQAAGDGSWELSESGFAFQGGFQVRGGRAGAWSGWRPDPAAVKAKAGSVAGLWLTDLGLMELEQKGNEVKGHFALGGVSEIEGTVSGKRLEFTYKGFRSGGGWFDIAPDGTMAGAAKDERSAGWYGWRGRRAAEFERDVKLISGKSVDGSTKGLLTYTIRAPEGFRAGDKRKWPAIVILHGSNMNGKAYVSTIAAAWPDIARDYLLIGINGEQPSDIGNDPKFNYSYINYVGRSTFKGYPGTDRESPALVAEALDELRQVYPVSRYFVGGHSQGGFLTYSLLMNFPEKIAGAFPISAGVIFQCEPGAYADEKVRAAQRLVPLAIVHSRQDPVVSFSIGEYAATLFGQSGWGAFRFFRDDRGAGHMFARLPVREAIRWLEAQASEDPKKLATFAEQCLKERAYRDAQAALDRANSLKPDAETKLRLDRVVKEIDVKAAGGAKEFLSKIKSNQDGGWIDAFLEYRDQFEFAPAARETMEAFDALRAQHEQGAIEAMNQARAAFSQGRADEGYAKYQEIVDKYYAAMSYRNVKRWLGERK